VNSAIMERLHGISFLDTAKDPKGTIYLDEDLGDFRVLIMRGPTAMCAYVGVPLGHPLAKTERDHAELVRYWKANRIWSKVCYGFFKPIIDKIPWKVKTRLEGFFVGHYPDLHLGFRCHYGETFSDIGDGKIRPAGYWWYGWDYGHLHDVSFFDIDPENPCGGRAYYDARTARGISGRARRGGTTPGNDQRPRTHRGRSWELKRSGARSIAGGAAA